jgi:hypothetical protein
VNQAEHVIFIGDVTQLGPQVTSESAIVGGLKKSILELMMDSKLQHYE